MNRTITLSILSTLAVSIGCAHGTSRELLEARKSYDEAKNGAAGTLAKSEVYDAKKALDAAEAAHKDKPNSDREVDLAYVAMRKADYATIQAQYLQYKQENSEADAQYLSTLERQKQSAENQLEQTSGELQKTASELERERQVREALQRQLGAAMASLQDMANVKTEDQRTIITLNGAVLFKTDDTKLLPIAQEKLGQVAEVLKQYGNEYSISVEGHTDSRGSDTHNQKLSQARAESVRSYLVDHGVAADSIRAVGRGEERPIADNNSAEGRADNRRVEIIVDRKADGGATPASGSQGAGDKSKK